MSHPYRDLPGRSFWRHCADAPDFGRSDYYQPAFPITAGMRIATAGSCFAQHVGAGLRRSRAELIDAEPAPAMMSAGTARRFGYGLFSARYGNVYTARQLVQLIRDADATAVHADAIWQRDGRFWDALRPGVEPDGLDSAEEVAAHRRQHLAAVRQMLSEAEVFVFTLGLTEMWVHKATGRAYPTCPGVIAGRFDADQHGFENADYPAVLSDLQQARQLIRAQRPGAKLVLTVSPVPLAATATGGHVLPATTYSKSVLRAAAGAMAAAHDDVDYVPSFEVITGAPSAARFYAPGLREVTHEGVEAAMSVFFGAHPELAANEPGAASEESAPPDRPASPLCDEPEDDLVCEERLLDAFRP